MVDSWISTIFAMGDAAFTTLASVVLEKVT